MTTLGTTSRAKQLREERGIGLPEAARIAKGEELQRAIAQAKAFNSVAGLAEVLTQIVADQYGVTTS